MKIILREQMYIGNNKYKKNETVGKLQKLISIKCIVECILELYFF